MVESIEEVRLKLQIDFLSDGNPFAQREVPQVTPGALDHTDAGCASSFVRRRPESRLIEPRRQRVSTVLIDRATQIIRATITEGAVTSGRRCKVLTRLPARDPA